jgi:hypothetical protein
MPIVNSSLGRSFRVPLSLSIRRDQRDEFFSPVTQCGLPVVWFSVQPTKAKLPLLERTYLLPLFDNN